MLQEVANMAKRIKVPRLASRKFKRVLRDKPFGVSASMRWHDPKILYDDWDGEIFEDSDHDDSENEDFFDDEEETRMPLDFN
jgi:hypothetical protein